MDSSIEVHHFVESVLNQSLRKQDMTRGQDITQAGHSHTHFLLPFPAGMLGTDLGWKYPIDPAYGCMRSTRDLVVPPVWDKLDESGTKDMFRYRGWLGGVNTGGVEADCHTRIRTSI